MKYNHIDPYKSGFRLVMLSFIMLLLAQMTMSDLRPRISEVNVKLPICRSKVEAQCSMIYYRLKGFDGCFDWELSEHNSFLKLENLPTKNNPNCFKALISTKINFDPETFIYITATERDTGYKFKTKVGFAYINKISVYKRFDSMNVGDSLELGIVAKDLNKNTFSSVEGLSFNWGFAKANSIAEFSKLSNGKLKFSEFRTKIEENSYSDIVLISGLITGQVEVYAELLEVDYNKLRSSNKPIIVRQTFEIDRKELWIMTNTYFDIKLMLIVERLYDKYNQQSNRPIERVPVEEANYKNYLFSLADPKCGVIQNQSNKYYSGKDSCNTVMKAVDSRLKEYNNSILDIHVIDPDKLELGFKEYGSTECYRFSHSWNLVVGKKYKIKNFLSYKNKNIYFSEEVVKFNTDVTQLLKSASLEFIEQPSKNGKSFVVRAIKSTNAYYEAKSIVEIDRKATNLEAKKQIKIYNPIRIEKFGQPKFYLPHIFPYHQRLVLIVKDGSGTYSIESANENAIIVKDGVLFSNHKGTSVIKVIDQLIEGNFDKIEIEVKSTLKIITLEEKQEVLVENSAQLMLVSTHLQSNFTIFTNCTDINSHISLINHDDVHYQLNQDVLTTTKAQGFYSTFEPRLKELLGVVSDVQLEYLEYANYGVCGKISVESKIPKLFTLNELSLNYATKERFFASNKPQIQFYKELSQIYPITNDPHDLKMLKKHKEYVESSIVISPNSKVLVEFSNGLSPWAENPSKFILTTNVYKNSSQEKVGYNEYRYTFKITEINKKSVEVECYKESFEEYLIEVSVGSIGLPSLVKPKTSLAKFTFSCSKVSYFSMNFEEDYDRDDVLSHPQPKGIVYSRQINSKNSLRVYALDWKLRLFTTFQGAYGKIKRINDLKDIKENSESKLFYHSIKFNLGELISKIPVEYYNYDVEHNLIIQSVNIPYIFPKESRIFLYNDNVHELDILNGSGEFEITNSDPTVAYAEYDPKASPRKIKVYPKKNGILNIGLKDKKHSLTSVISTAQVIVADIHRIFIIAPNYLMVGNKLSALVKVYDKNGNHFDETQVRKMKLQLDKHESGQVHTNEVEHISRVLILNSEIVNQIEIQGYSEGIQALSLISVNGIESNLVHIQVFDKLEVFPPMLLLYPGAVFTLKVVGGPNNEKSLNKHFSIDKPDIAYIGKSTPTVKAKTIGHATIKISLRYRSEENQLYSTEDERIYYNKLRNTVFCEVDVPVQVAFPERIEIEGANNRKIYVDSIIRVIASLKLGDISFTYGLGNAEYSWSVDNPLLAQFSNRNKKNSCITPASAESNNSKIVSSEEVNQEIGSFLISYALGQVSIKLVIKINYPEPYTNHRPNLFSIKKIISIEENVWFDVAEFYDRDPNKSSLYLLPLGVTHQLQTNKQEQNVSYSIIRSPTSNKADIIKLSKTGRVETSLQSGLTMVQIEKAGKSIPTVLNVFVTNYHSIFAEKSHKVIAMEAGSELNLKLAIQHESGLLFANSKFKIYH